jgi:alkylated DNA repair protein (DNA oxidative demethylase)
MPADLFDDLPVMPDREQIADGAVLLRGFACDRSDGLIAAVDGIAAVAPFRHMETPGGFTMSVAMTNCGAAGWVTDRTGYRYDRCDPQTGLAWPAMPPAFAHLAAHAAAEAGFAGFDPDSCLINRYQPGARMSLHQDRNERDFAQPIVSVSLGLPATFLFGGAKRADRPRRISLGHGDVVVWGGPARLNFHGVAPLADGHHPMTGQARINLTFRSALIRSV